MKISDVAKAFIEGKSAKCGNAITNGVTYQLHGHTIARKRIAAGDIEFNWCGYHTPTTANHLNKIRREMNLPIVSYAVARDAGATTFTS